MPLFMWMSSKHLFTTFHNCFSQKKIFGSRFRGPRRPQRKNPPFFQWHPARFRRKVFAARAKDAKGREEVDVVVIGARVCWLDAESWHTPGEDATIKVAIFKKKRGKNHGKTSSKPHVHPYLGFMLSLITFRELNK